MPLSSGGSWRGGGSRGVALAVAVTIAVGVIAAIAAYPHGEHVLPAHEVPDAALPHDAATPARSSYRGVLLVGSSVGPLRDPRGRIERVLLEGEEVRVERIDHTESDVVHVVRAEHEGSMLVAAGGPALLERWSRVDGSWTRRTLWRARFGLSSRMRDLERGSVWDPGAQAEGDALVVGTHDEGVVARVVASNGDDARVVEIDREPRTLVHEIELGDLDGDGALEIYATRSPPNTLVPGVVQPGSVVRYVPSRADASGRVAREVLIDLAPRHAKEILASDLDGDGRDELYVVVEALLRTDSTGSHVIEPVEVRRITSERPPPGDVIAHFEDRSTRFLVAGDVDGDGRRELVAATFSAGLWVLRPSDDATRPWTRELVDDASGGYEHAIALADLDGNGAEEIYAAADPSHELRRYSWGQNGWQREVLVRHDAGEERITWSLAAGPPSVGSGANSSGFE